MQLVCNLAQMVCRDYNDIMDRFPAPFEILAQRRTLSWLLVPVMLLPIGTTVLFLFGQVFALLNDTLSASVLHWTALALSIVWCLTLVLLGLCAVLVLLRDEPEDEM